MLDSDAGDARRSPFAARGAPRAALLGGAMLLGVLGAFASARLLAYAPRPAPPASRRVAASPTPAPPAPPVAWPRPLPHDPGQWMRQAAAECGLKVTGVKSDAHATTFPTPSGGSVVLWEYALRLGAEGALDDVRALLGRLGHAPCGVHVPTVDINWLPGGRVRVQLDAVLLGTWPDKAGPATARS